MTRQKRLLRSPERPQVALGLVEATGIKVPRPPDEILDLGRALGRMLARVDFDAELAADQHGR